MRPRLAPHRGTLAMALLGSMATPAPCQGDGGTPASVVGALAEDWTDTREVELPGTQELAAVAAATAVDVARVQRCQLFRAKRGEGSTVEIARVPIAGENAVAVIALADDMSFVTAAVTDPDDQVLDEWQHFMAGLRFHAVPRLAGAQPRSELAALRERALAKRDDADARLTIALLDMLRHMNEQAAAFNLPRDRSRDREAEWRTAGREYAAVAGPQRTAGGHSSVTPRRSSRSSPPPPRRPRRALPTPRGNATARRCAPHAGS